MELLPTPDFLESIDFNFLTTEIYHDHEHDFTLTDGDKMQLDWHDGVDENEEVFESQIESEVEPMKIVDITEEITVAEDEHEDVPAEDDKIEEN